MNSAQPAPSEKPVTAVVDPRLVRLNVLTAGAAETETFPNARMPLRGSLMTMSPACAAVAMQTRSVNARADRRTSPPPLEDLRRRGFLGQPAERLVDPLPLGHQAVDLALEPLLLVLELLHLVARRGVEEAGVRELLVDLVNARLGAARATSGSCPGGAAGRAARRWSRVTDGVRRARRRECCARRRPRVAAHAARAGPRASRLGARASAGGGSGLRCFSFFARASTAGGVEVIVAEPLEVLVVGALEVVDAARRDLEDAGRQLDTNQRSWETKIRVPWNFSRPCASASIASRSRWLVGSSSTSTFGFSTAIRANSRRAASPPDRLPTRFFTSSPEKSTRPS